MKKCPNGHEVSGDVKFCPQCGAEMLEDVAEDVRFCKKCGNERRELRNSVLIAVIPSMEI